MPHPIPPRLSLQRFWWSLPSAAPRPFRGEPDVWRCCGCPCLSLWAASSALRWTLPNAAARPLRHGHALSSPPFPLPVSISLERGPSFALGLFLRRLLFLGTTPTPAGGESCLTPSRTSRCDSLGGPRCGSTNARLTALVELNGDPSTQCSVGSSRFTNLVFPVICFCLVLRFTALTPSGSPFVSVVRWGVHLVGYLGVLRHPHLALLTGTRR